MQKTLKQASQIKTSQVATSASTTSPQRKTFSALLICFLIIFLVIIGFITTHWLFNHDKTASLNLYVAPASADIYLNQEKLKTEGLVKVKPGNYTITVSKSGFNSLTKELYLEPEKTTTFYEYLEPISENSEYYKTHPEEQSRIQHISDLKADQESIGYSSTDPIFKITPYSSYKEGFSISAKKQENTSKIKLKINLLTCSEDQIPNLKEAALRYLKKSNINYQNYDLEYTDC